MLFLFHGYEMSNKMDVQVFLQNADTESLEYIPKGDISGSYGFVFLDLWGPSILISIVLGQFAFPQAPNKGSRFPESLPACVVMCFLDDVSSHSNWAEAKFQSGFTLYFLDG